MAGINSDHGTSKEPLCLTGNCYCKNLSYTLKLEDKNDARTTLCHCKDCKKAFGGAFGLTAKCPIQTFHYTSASGKPTLHVANNGSGSTVYREFCNKCGSYICEYGEQAKDAFRYVVVGSLDDPGALPPKGEFFCSERETWMPKIPGTFQKDKIKE
ncbi:DUF636 domain protein [Bimuria novae-zelandiae CBS 107.79]|uniref:DUF636 domain protein n=1 Tax=Bimuria novae-zelandiae CBS 107.79 TaxID=1447943 RepID=A0A6A5V9H7_9PLEO|nr:DUF636 domain protein [Bimuria novae-zelandiae CBS 107.79]